MSLRRKVRGSRSAASAGGRTRPGGMRAAGGGEGRRGVRKKAEVPVEPDEEMSGNVDENVGEPMTTVEDIQLLEAQSTIERLRRKYLSKGLIESPGSSTRDIIRVEEEEEEDRGLLSDKRGPVIDTGQEYEFRGSQDEEVEMKTKTDKVRRGKENRVTRQRSGKQHQGARSRQTRGCKPRKEPLSSLPMEGDTVKSSPHTFKTPAKRPSRSKSSPELKVPTPSLGHSTPSSVSRKASSRRPSLYGFEALDSPLSLSPVSASPYTQVTPFKSPQSKAKEPSPYTKLLGINDIPLKKPTPKRHCGKRKEQPNRSSEIDAWAKELQAEFAKVDEFDLVVE